MIVICFLSLPIGALADSGKAITPAGDVTYLAFSSDVHNKSANDSANRLNTWIDNVSSTLGKVTFDNMGFCGDMADANVSESNYWSYAEKAIKVVKNSNKISGDGFFVCGNHEWSPGRFGSTTNSVKNYYSVPGTTVVTSDYILYSFGAANNGTSNSFAQSDIDALGNYLKTAPTDKPIFILSHFPLHNEGSRNITRKDNVISTLNQYADGRTLFFLWGHNHTDSDRHYDQFYTESLDGTAIKFTYSAAGCMSDREYGNGSAYVKGKGLVAEIFDNCVRLSYYSADGKVVGTPALIGLSESGSDPVDPPVTEPEVINYSSAGIVFEDNCATAVVSCSQACDVFTLTGKDTYTRLTAAKRSNGVYIYDLHDISGDFKLVVALVGDSNLDGTMNSVDLTQARAVAKGKLIPGSLNKQIIDVNHDGEFNSVDIVQIRAYFKGKVEYTW